MQAGGPMLRIHSQDSDRSNRLLVSLATYNERANLAGLVAAIHAARP